MKIKESFIRYKRRWKKEIKENWRNIILATAFAWLAMYIMLASGAYTDKVYGSEAAPDLILDAIPSLNLNFLFVWPFFLINYLFFLYPLFYQPKKYYYVIMMLALFIFIRAVFVSLTHLQVPHDSVAIDFPTFFGNLLFANDLFFSGHTGTPFLGFLVFEAKWLKYLMLILSFVMAGTVLFMHVHYSIDVLAAYFITYGIYKIGNRFFKK